ncbi:MAG: hypothetical protein CMJ85_05120 [Planctomycetes bacterium]|nr:hypothetical protein [Planctomycetota bacterium]
MFAALVCCTLLASPSYQGKVKRPDAPAQQHRKAGLTDATTLAVSLQREAEALCRRGAAALARLQNESGDFDLGRDTRNPAPIAVSALATLALLSTGEVPARTRFGRNVELGALYLLRHQDRSKGAKHGYIGIGDDKYSKMHGHGYATLALAQLVGMLPDRTSAVVTQKQVRTGLRDAVALIQRCQDPHTGGWSYDPVARDHEGSMTVCMVQALRAAKDAGVLVDYAVIKRALGYVSSSQKPDGSFRYQLGSENSSTALTAAAVMTLNATGDWQSDVLRKGMAYLTDQSSILRDGLMRRIPGRFPYYERLYVGEALFTAPEQDTFKRWFARLVRQMSTTIEPRTGTWKSESYGRAYATAMTVLVLSLPLQYLPIHQR